MTGCALIPRQRHWWTSFFPCPGRRRGACAEFLACSGWMPDSPERGAGAGAAYPLHYRVAPGGFTGRGLRKLWQLSNCWRQPEVRQFDPPSKASAVVSARGYIRRPAPSWRLRWCGVPLFCMTPMRSGAGHPVLVRCAAGGGGPSAATERLPRCRPLLTHAVRQDFLLPAPFTGVGPLAKGPPAIW